jgi:hypothetical protein
MLKMRAILIFVLASASVTLSSSAHPQVETWELVAKLCGRLQHSNRIPHKNIPGQFSEKISPIKDAKLVAYEAPSNSVCCSNTRVAGEATTNKNGNFEFKGLTKGYYWLVARADDREYRMSIRIGQLQDKQPVCSEMSFEIDASGEFALHFRAPGR